MTTTSEVLNRAADLIQERGWVAGHGWPTIGAPTDTPLCLEGGVMAAMGVELPADDEGSHIGEFWECDAYRAVTDYLRSDNRWANRAHELDNPVPRAWQWNDARGRTAEEVIEVLRSAAAIEEARETGATINMGGDNPTLTHNGVTYVAGAL